MSMMKIALVHDYLNQYGGAERLLEAEMELWPQAPVYTSIYDQEVMNQAGFDYPQERVKPSFMQNFPFRRSFNKHYFFIYPFAFNFFDFNQYDVVVSDSSYSAKYINFKKPTVHIAYIHTPPRFLWGYDQELTSYHLNWFDYLFAPIYKLVVPPIKNLIRRKDFDEVKKIDYLVCNSKEVQKRIAAVYKRQAAIIYPPVDVEKFINGSEDAVLKTENYFLIVSRLGGYKRFDIAIEAFNQLGYPLKIIGTGPEEDNLKKMAKDNVQFLGRVSDTEVIRYMKNARAFIFPTEEDFGVVCVEANAAGIPVIAYGKGGALETIVDGKSGLFFQDQTAESLLEALKKFETTNFDPKVCQDQAKKFSKETFQEKLKEFVEEKVAEKKNQF